jgi:hypothetical protein
MLGFEAQPMSSRVTSSVPMMRVCVMFSPANSVYTDTEARITDDIADADSGALSPWSSITWHLDCQYNNSNITDDQQVQWLL